MSGDVRSSGPLVTVHGLSKVFQPFPRWMRFLVRTPIKQPVVALDDVTFEVNPGEICAVVGPNGAGKSTLFRILAGLLTATSGSATVNGVDAAKQPAAARRSMGFMPADARSLYLRQTCLENLQFHGRLQGIREKRLSRKIDDILEVVGLTHARDWGGWALSSGMKARLQFARALLHEPSVLLLDEPTGTVDPIGSHHLLEVIKQATTQLGLAVLIASHRLEEIEALHDNVVFLDRGRLVYWGNLDTFRRTWEKRQLRIEFVDAERAARAAQLLEQVSGIDLVTAEPPSLIVATRLQAGRVLAALDGDLEAVVAIDEQKVPLRELLARMIQQGTGERLGEGETSEVLV